MYNPLLTNVPSPKVSPKYSMIHSGQFSLHMLLNNCALTRQKGSSRSPYGKHVMRFDTGLRLPSGDILEIVAKNSHDGTCAFQLTLGIYRLVCSNGLVVGKSLVETVPIRHIGYTAAKVKDAVAQLLSQKSRVYETVAKLQNTQLTLGQQITFAKLALEIRGITDANNPEQSWLFSSRRNEDKGDNAWVTFNRVQEHLTRGFKYVNKDGESVTARRISAVERDININKQLFDAIVKIAAQEDIMEKITVYIETPNGSYCEKIAVFTSEDLYMVCLPILEQYAKSINMLVTESEE